MKNISYNKWGYYINLEMKFQKKNAILPNNY